MFRDEEYTAYFNVNFTLLLILYETKIHLQVWNVRNMAMVNNTGSILRMNARVTRRP